ncbi:quinolinate synthase NadA [Caloramator proteoclasticus]|uniref:Quinolinate synthase n=1 Tax=Caloramator proteoclasticus DSM 10124 TaxID=1121262 RepID=A0A1M4Y301_9CLOT|nr:quinolinate synthase NadA [Caloramator proteoclasticus]SHF00068.1 quinolinate synthetase [Caloramator proteoclasticus DSM 10124]
MRDKIIKLKKDLDAIILAHNYQRAEVLDIADYVGDSFYLSQIAKKCKNKTIVFAGVHFMAESAKILSPEKEILLPVLDALCPLSDMVNIETLKEFKEKYSDYTFVCYINTSADVKALCNVVVTSSNAEKIISRIENDKIVFLPDKNLGEHIKNKFPNKKFIIWDGFCPTHQRIQVKHIISLKEKINNLVVLAHPECNSEVREVADFLGSTKEIIDFANKTDYKNYLIATEDGVIHTLKQNNPNKNFYVPGTTATCINMKKTTLEDIYNSLLYKKHSITVDEEISNLALKSLMKMIELAG